MLNLAMKRKLDAGEAIDLSKCKRLGPYYVIPMSEAAIDGFDLCDAQGEIWIWSAGITERAFSFKHGGVDHVVPEGTHLASTQGDLYQREGVHCTFLR